jgi:hypothetical protein
LQTNDIEWYGAEAGVFLDRLQLRVLEAMNPTINPLRIIDRIAETKYDR